ncbi:MAG TPA: hypothetical protein VFV02_00385, partial [Acidimicrobiales bacterium]|nr:hypothetical protein [Acidimicrobiales bacterium]
MAIHSQRYNNRRPHASSQRVGLLSTLGRVLIATGLSSGALVGVAVATQTAASAAGFGPDAFMNIDGNIQYVANGTPPPTNEFGWANSGTPATGCSGGPTGAVHLSGSNGLYDCGAPNPLNTASKTFVPLAPNYIGPPAGTNGALAQQFISSPTPNDWVDCGSGTSAQGSYS